MTTHLADNPSLHERTQGRAETVRVTVHLELKVKLGLVPLCDQV